MKTAVIALTTFALGVGAGYVIFSEKSHKSTPHVHSSSPKQPSDLAVANTPPTQPKVIAPEQQVEVIVEGLTEPDAQQSDESVTPEQEVIALREELAQAKATISRLRTSPEPGKDLELELRESFDAQQRNEVWAYEVETLINDFVYSQNLAGKVEVEMAQCKSTICRVEFKALTSEQQSLDPRHRWSNVNELLSQQPWWQQFMRTVATSNNDTLNLWVERPQPEQ